MPTRRDLLSSSAAGLALCAAVLPAQAAIAGPDRIFIVKWKRTLTLIEGGKPQLTYRVALGHAPKGHKERQGDGRTPEGVYHVDQRRFDSAYHRALRLSYPSPADRQQAARRGVSPGGQIMIHGLDPAIEAEWEDDHWLFNWTNGCVAVTNREMDVLWERVRLGTLVEIVP